MDIDIIFALRVLVFDFNFIDRIEAGQKKKSRRKCSPWQGGGGGADNCGAAYE